MLLRFVVDAIDRDSGRRRGVVHAAAELRDSDSISTADRGRLRAIADWFNENLERPATFAVSKKPHAKAQAISWLKADAAEHVRRMWELHTLLGKYGVHVNVIRTTRPGYVIYEDEHQVTAYPFSDTRT